MKILWLCNIMLPIISKTINEKINPYGGWLSGLCDSIIEKSNLNLTICFPYAKATPLLSGKASEISYYGFNESDKNTDIFCKIIKDCQPDIIHIWGTEYRHTLDMVNAAEICGCLDRVVINIQGLVSICGKYHYYCGIPDSYCKSASLIELRYHSNIENRRLNFIKKGEFEIEALKKIKHVVGRTDWDEACTKQLNHDVNYYHCNESLRSSFYNYEWNINSCEKYSIFLSQANYPIKGFHLMLEAMPLILERFPQAHIYTTGYSPREKGGWKYALTYDSYSRYLRELLDKHNLNEHVSFTGFLNEKEMCDRFLHSHVFVSSSSIENSSNSVGEAMLLGMPIVSSDVGGIKNLLTHGEEGYIYQWDAPYMLAYYVCKIFEDDTRAVMFG